MPILISKGAGSAQGFGFAGGPSSLIQATGGTIITCGNYKTHIFTGPGTFSVSKVSPTAAAADYLVVAGGGGTGGPYSAGAGAGGFRISNTPGSGIPAPTMSPLSNPTGITLTATSYPITVGGGGTATVGTCGPGGKGSDSTFSTITSTGGGKGGYYLSHGSPTPIGEPGGSGSGGGHPTVRCAGSGNTPPTSPAQGTPGGVGSPGNNAQGGGGGAAVAGTNGGPGNTTPGIGGAGSFIANSFIGPTSSSYGTPGPVSNTRYFAGGGGGGSDVNAAPGVGGVGGGGNSNLSPGPGCTFRTAGTINTGGGAGGGPNLCGKTGGSGIVLIRYKFK